MQPALRSLQCTRFSPIAKADAVFRAEGMCFAVWHCVLRKEGCFKRQEVATEHSLHSSHQACKPRCVLSRVSKCVILLPSLCAVVWATVVPARGCKLARAPFT